MLISVVICGFQHELTHECHEITLIVRGVIWIPLHPGLDKNSQTPVLIGLNLMYASEALTSHNNVEKVLQAFFFRTGSAKVLGCPRKYTLNLMDLARFIQLQTAKNEQGFLQSVFQVYCSIGKGMAIGQPWPSYGGWEEKGSGRIYSSLTGKQQLLNLVLC